MSGAIDSVSGGMQYNPVQKAGRAGGTEDVEKDDARKGYLERMNEDTVDISEQARKLSEEKRELDREKSDLEEKEQAEKAEERKRAEEEGSWAVTEVDGDPRDPSSMTSRVVAQGKGQLPPGY